MADENVFRTSTMPPARSGVRTRAVIGTALLAFVLGGAAVGYAVWQGLVPPALEPVARLAEAPAPRASTAPASGFSGSSQCRQMPQSISRPSARISAKSTGGSWSCRARRLCAASSPSHRSRP